MQQILSPAPSPLATVLAAGMLLATGAMGCTGARASGEAADQKLAEALGGRWTRTGGCERTVQFQLAGDTLRVVALDGHVDLQRVLERRATGLATMTMSSTHGTPAGARWVYEVLAPGQLSLTDGTGRSAEFQHCRVPIPATATPAEFLHGLFAIYADSADASLPFASEAGLRAFLVPDFADRIARYDARLRAGGHIDAVCLPAEPITGAQDDYRVTDIKVSVADPDPATPGHTTGTVSFRNMDAPISVHFDLRRSPAGWRIDDLRSGTGPSLRTQMTHCAAAD